MALAAGAEVAASVTAPLRSINPRFLIGTGKLAQLKQVASDAAAELVLVDHHLSPAQERNLEKELQRRVVDRSGLILDIFAQRARTFEGKLQVELAQLEHLSTRLVRGWTHLERQKGGIGLRGPGETQLETDRRLVSKRIRALQERLRSFRAPSGPLAPAAPPSRSSRRIPGRLHECRQVDSVQSAHGRRRLGGRPVVCHIGSHSARGAATGWRAYRPGRYRWLHPGPAS